MRKVFASLFALLLPSYALAGDVTEWLSVDTYLRARALSSLNGGQSGTLGNSTLLGRLMNESTKLQVDAEARPMQDVLAHIRLEGETFKGADTNFGSLAKLVLTQTYVQIDNCLTDGLSPRWVGRLFDGCYAVLRLETRQSAARDLRNPRGLFSGRR